MLKKMAFSKGLFKNILWVCLAGVLLVAVPAEAATSVKPVAKPVVKATPSIPGQMTVIDPFKLLLGYLIPSTAEYTIPSWSEHDAVIHWETPNLVFQDTNTQFFGFHHFGKVGSWSLKLFGPRAGVDAVQFMNQDPLWTFNVKNALAKYQIQSKPIACNAAGTLLQIIAPGKKPAHLFVGFSAFTLLTSDTPPTVQALDALGIHQLSATGCRF